ncbi:FliI/YscN family ATPase [Myxococcota bacterium]|nr:FliI/YscN family ATPase [Myxococcota bacterium]MBU1429664.1 FliI/YscN family ATPase [Myxococcota bacterium]MBU1898125.1 FliI/YscN family ATPase [Myxococcota bacterium]
MFNVDQFGLDLDALRHRLDEVKTVISRGKVTQVIGLLVEGYVPDARVGGLCEIAVEGEGQAEAKPVMAEVVGFRGRTALLMPLSEIDGVRMGSLITPRRSRATVAVGQALLGRVLDGLGRPLDGAPLPPLEAEVPLYAEPLNPLSRQPIDAPLWLGIRAIDALLTCGRGMRMGVFAGSGVGKSVTLGMMARNAASDINVIALIGERGREVLSFIHKDLGPEGLARSVVIAATSDTAPLVRLRAANLATAIAEHFRDQGAQVLLMMDSLTRFAMAQREIGLSAGEPPTTRGYPPSVFARLPKLLERAGTCAGQGSITGLYTVLVEADDMNDPIGDTVRSIIDGHIVLSRDLAAQNHYPAIDVLVSASRVMGDVTTPKHRAEAGALRALLAAHRKAEDLINIGAYQKGANPQVDKAIARIDKINGLLRQGIEERVTAEQALRLLTEATR